MQILTRVQVPILLTALLAIPAGFAQNTDFSWRFGPVDLPQGQTPKFTFANPFCSSPATQLDITLALTDLSGKVLQVRAQGDQTAAAKKHAIVACNDAIQLEVSGAALPPGTSTVVGVLQVITDINGVPWTPVNVPLASLQIGEGFGTAFKPSVVLISTDPIRRLLLP
jgi:hypothetical protein